MTIISTIKTSLDSVFIIWDPKGCVDSSCHHSRSLQHFLKFTRWQTVSVDSAYTVGKNVMGIRGFKSFAFHLVVYAICHRWWSCSLQVWRKLNPVLEFSWFPIPHIQRLWWVQNYLQCLALLLVLCHFKFEIFCMILFCRLGHYTVPKEMEEVCNWLHTRLGLEGSR